MSLVISGWLNVKMASSKWSHSQLHASEVGRSGQGGIITSWGAIAIWKSGLLPFMRPYSVNWLTQRTSNPSWLTCTTVLVAWGTLWWGRKGFLQTIKEVNISHSHRSDNLLRLTGTLRWQLHCSSGYTEDTRPYHLAESVSWGGQKLRSTMCKCRDTPG